MNLKFIIIGLALLIINFPINAQWFVQNPSSPGANNLRSVKFIDENNGWAVGDGVE